MSLEQVSSLGGAGGVFLSRHLSGLVESLSCEVRVSTKSLTKIERNRFINAFKDGFLKASPRTRSAAMYKLICAQHGLVPLILHASKGASNYNNCYLGVQLTHDQHRELGDRIYAAMQIAGSKCDRKWCDPSQSSNGVWFEMPAHQGMSAEAFVRSVGEGIFPMQESDKRIAALRFVQENGSIHFRTTKHAAS